MGHGYLLGSFLSPLTNDRSDGFGGELDARMRYPLEVFDAVRRTPGERPVGVALNGSDWRAGGTRPEETVTLARALKDRGCAFIRVVAGQTVPGFDPHYDPYFLTHYADRIRNEVGIATIATGDISTVDHVNTIVAGGGPEL